MTLVYQWTVLQTTSTTTYYTNPSASRVCRTSRTVLLTQHLWAHYTQPNMEESKLEPEICITPLGSSMEEPPSFTQ